MANLTGHPVKAQGVSIKVREQVKFFVVVEFGLIMPRWGMARGAFVLQFLAMGWVNHDFVADFSPPERVFGTVGHHGAAPIVIDIYVFSGGGDERAHVRVVSVAAVAGFGGGEQDIGVYFKETIGDFARQGIANAGR